MRKPSGSHLKTQWQPHGLHIRFTL